MINQEYALFENFDVDSLRQVPCLVVVHGDARSEKYGWNAVVYEYALVGKTVEHLCEVRTTVVREIDVKVDSEHPVADGEHIPFDRLK